MGSGSSKPPLPQDYPEAWELLSYLPPYGENYEFSHTHFLYSNDIQRLEDECPPPHTAPTRKHEIFDPEAYTHVDERTDALQGFDLEKTLNELVRLLTGDYEDDLSKIRALYRWFTAQPVERADYKKGAKANTAMFHLYNLKHKKNTYAGFFALLCWYANLPCAIIRGYLKGSTYEVGQKIDKNLHRGEWNAVLIDGNWRLINAFWGACVLSDDIDNDKQDYVYTCDEDFFLADPQQIIYTHFPEEPNWQLIDNKKTIKEFETMVFLKDRFFTLEMRVLSHPFCNIEAKEGEVDILFGLHPEKSVNHTFLCIPTFFVEGGKSSRTRPVELPQKNVQLDFVHRPNENVLSIKVRFPKVGTYKLEIVGKDMTVRTPEYDFDWVAIYKVEVKSIPEKQTFFPILEAAGWGPNKLLEEFGLVALSHQTGVIKMLPGPLEVKFKIVDQAKFTKIGANIVHALLPLGNDDDSMVERNPFKKNGDILSATVNVEPGEFKMKISHLFGEGHEHNICNYHVICNPAPAPVPVEDRREPTPDNDEEDELRENLRTAIESQDLELLERSVDLVESKGYANKLGPELREARDLIARLKRLQKLIHEVMTLNQRTISEIRSYAHPIHEVHVVMRATLMLLGNAEDETKEWKNVQMLIGKTGKQSLKRRIQEVDVNRLTHDTLKKAKNMLKDIKLEDIVIISCGAATFYSWSLGIVEEGEQRFKNK